MKKLLKKWYLIVLAIVVCLVINKCLGGEKPCEFPQRDKVDELVISRHAKCRMGCRKVSHALLENVYENGEVNCAKSSKKNGEMRYALELEDPVNGDDVRVIIADDKNDDEHVVVTVIRLGREFNCHCN